MDIYGYNLELFSMGIGGSLDTEDYDYIHFGLPSLYFYEENGGLVLEINSLNFEFNRDQTTNYYFLNSRFYYSFMESTNFILGPYLGTGFETFGDFAFISDIGVSFRYLHDVDMFSFIPNFVLRGASIDVGYSINDDEIYLKLTTDPFLIAYFTSYIFM